MKPNDSWMFIIPNPHYTEIWLNRIFIKPEVITCDISGQFGILGFDVMSIGNKKQAMVLWTIFLFYFRYFEWTLHIHDHDFFILKNKRTNFNYQRKLTTEFCPVRKGLSAEILSKSFFSKILVLLCFHQWCTVAQWWHLKDALS